MHLLYDAIAACTPAAAWGAAFRAGELHTCVHRYVGVYLASFISMTSFLRCRASVRVDVAD